MKRCNLLIVLAGLLLAACVPATAPAPAAPATQPAPIAAPTAAPPVATQPAPTAAPSAAAPAATAVAATPAAEGQRSAAFGGVTFQYPAVVAEGAAGKNMPAGPSPYYPAGVTVPQHVEIGLTGYPLTGTIQAPVVMVFPAAELAASHQEAAARIAALKQLLSSQPADLNGVAANGVPDLPFLPMINAKQATHFGGKYLTFQGGQGVRYLTQYAQGLVPINNQELFYTFQGLTGDGKYYVSAILPVSHAGLPAAAEAMPQAEREAMLANYTQYLKDTTAALAAQPDASFKPGLADLDSVIQSLQIATPAS